MGRSLGRPETIDAAGRINFTGSSWKNQSKRSDYIVVCSMSSDS